LKHLDTSHAKILSDVRLDLALKLLQDDRVNVETVAIELGYAHPGDFSRFFKNRMGCCPTEYRLRKFG
jgi:AraC-like DNA-binding protein